MNKGKRIATVNFFDTVAPNSSKTLVSKQINNKYRIKSFKISFAPGTNRLLELEPYVSPDADDPSDGSINGVNLIQQFSHKEVIVGDDERKRLEQNIIVAQRNTWLKIFANNTDSNEHSIDAQITVEIPQPGEDLTLFPRKEQNEDQEA